jgi:hypothetical protein
VPGLLARKEIPETGRLRRLVAAYVKTEVNFLVATDLIRKDAVARVVPLEEVVIHLSDLTPEAQDFVRSGAIDSWLGACDRKSNRMLAEGATEEERLAVYRDPKGLYKRLEKFRKERNLKLN